ncbi:beta strand repeat-containing protein, partial [Methylobacterium adhaesivum]
DGISNGIQTIQAANTGLTKLQGLTDQLKSVAQQALASANAFSTKATNTSVALTGATAANLLSTGPTQAVSDTAIGAASATPSSATGTAAYTLNGTAANNGAGTTFGTAAGTYTVSINGTATATIAQNATATDVATAINLLTTTTGVTADATSGKVVLTGSKSGAQFTYSATDAAVFNNTTLNTASNGVASTAQTLTVNGTAISIGATATVADAIAAINAQTSVTGVTAVNAGSEGGTAGAIKLKGALDGSGTFTAAGSASNTLGFAAGGATVTAGVFSPLPTSLATALGFTAGDNFTVNGQSVSIAATDTVTSLAQKVTIATNGTVSATFDATNRKFNFTAADSSTAVTLGNGSTATAKVAKLGFNANTTFAAGLGSGSASPLAGTSLTVKVGTGVSTSFTFGTAPGQISNLTQLNASLA